ncbi:MAG TPA: FtsX-like permease family protein, partial [Nocardioides sp.]|nr:FtsX-like permease family protein [Nocardioides sp.]
PFVAGRLTHAIGRPLPAIAGVTGRLGRENAARNPRRTAGTASALMVGVGLVAGLATIGSSMMASFSHELTKDITADYVVSSSSFSGFAPSVQTAVKNAPGVVAWSPYTEIDFHTNGARHTAAGIDPVTGPQVLNIPMKKGSVAALNQGEMLVDDKTATNDHLKVGDVLDLGFASTGHKQMTIGGTFTSNAFTDAYILPYKVVSAAQSQGRDELILLKTSARNASTQNALADALKDHPEVSVKTGSQFQKDQGKRFQTFLYVAYAMLALSIIIAAFSVVNTMALSVIERTKEVGLLRAIGMGRKQIRSMFRSEAVIVALFGAVLGLVIGLALGAAIVVAIGQTGFVSTRIVIPYATVVAVLILAGIIGVIAAVFPARRAAKLDVLQAIATA